MTAVDLVIRADASSASGAGHVMRTLVLAEAWVVSGAGQVGLVGAVELGFVERCMANLGVPSWERLPERGPRAVLVVDSYDETVRLEGAAWRSGSLRVLVDDRGGNVPAGYEVIWNPGTWGGETPYPGFRGVVLSGEAYVPVRPGLPRWSGAGAGRVAVFLGGGQAAPTLVEAMTRLAQDAPDITFSGAGAWVPTSWERLDADHPWTGAVRASALVTAAGTSLLEAANVGIPVVVLCAADNQAAGADWARRAAVPVVDARRSDAGDIAAAVGRALPLARPLPPLRNGAPEVARRLLELARERGAGA